VLLAAIAIPSQLATARLAALATFAAGAIRLAVVGTNDCRDGRNPVG
jgi:hypothetical protein